MINVTKFFIDCKMTLHMYSKFDSHNSSQYWHHFENHPSQPLAGERHGLEGGRRVEAAFKAGKARERRLCSQVSLKFCLWWPFFLVSTGQSRQSWTQGSMSVLARRTLWVFRSLHHHHIHLLLHHDFSAHDFVCGEVNKCYRHPNKDSGQGGGAAEGGGDHHHQNSHQHKLNQRR